MRLPKSTVALFALNLVLLAVIWRQRSLLAGRAESSAAGQVSSSSGPALASARFADSENPSGQAFKPRGMPSDASAIRATFDWRQIESDDYRTYIHNLRSVGCPEQTIRDIVSADVVNAFAARRQEAISNLYGNFKYWDSNPSNQVSAAELQRRRHAVDAEMNATLQDLLGQNYIPPDDSRAWTASELDQQLGFLTPDVRDKTETVLLQYADTDRAIQSLSEGEVTPDDPAARQEILQAYDAKRAALQAVLTAEQYQQLDMTVSWTADNLRQAMVHFDPTEGEFQTIFQAWRAWDEKLALLYATGQPDPGNDAVFNQIQQALGPERFQQYRNTWWK